MLDMDLLSLSEQEDSRGENTKKEFGDAERTEDET
jgi:hypothetical protein